MFRKDGINMADIFDKLIEAVSPCPELNRNRVELDKEIMKDYGFMITDNPAVGYILKECGMI